MSVIFTVKEPYTAEVSAGDECSWHYLCEIPAGTYEARCSLLNGTPCSLDDAYWVSVSIEGTCVGGWIPGYGNRNDAEKNFGKLMPAGFTLYGYQVTNAIAKNDPNCRWSVIDDQDETR